MGRPGSHFKSKSLILLSYGGPTLSFIHRRREVARTIGVLYHADLRRWLYGALSEPEGTSVRG